MWTTLQNPLALAGRILLALLFISAGVDKLIGFEGSVVYADSVGIPMPKVAVVLGLLVEIVGGLALLIGWGTRWAAIVLALLVLATGFFLYSFWNAPAAQAGLQQVLFYKSLAVIGGLLAFVAFGPGSLSADAHRTVAR